MTLIGRIVRYFGPSGFGTSLAPFAHDLTGGIGVGDGLTHTCPPGPPHAWAAADRMLIAPMPTGHHTRPGETALDARAREAAVRVYRQDLVDILRALTTAMYSGSRERFRQAAHDAAGRIRRSVAALEVADLEHQLRTGRLLFQIGRCFKV